MIFHRKDAKSLRSRFLLFSATHGNNLCASVIKSFNRQLGVNSKKLDTANFFAKAYSKFMKHSTEFIELAEDAKSRVKEISVEEVQERMKTGASLIDVREDNEWNEEHAKGAIHIGRGILERDIVGKFPDKDAELILYCGGGYRSALAADNLQKMGYTNVLSMTGGWTAYQERMKAKG